MYVEVRTILMDVNDRSLPTIFFSKPSFCDGRFYFKVQV